MLREYRDGLNYLDNTLKIIEMHNRCVKPNDWFLFVGDISEQEYFDQNITRYLSVLQKYWNMLNGKKILIKGNNDTGSNEFYKKLGFREIYDFSVKVKDLLFSHAPCGKLPPDVSLNIHGHIHGNCQYWGMSKNKMIDCYYGLFGKVLRLNELIDYYKSGKYHGVNVPSKPMEPDALIPILDLSN